jgi:hypothetical protein
MLSNVADAGIGPIVIKRRTDGPAVVDTLRRLPPQAPLVTTLRASCKPRLATARRSSHHRGYAINVAATTIKSEAPSTGELTSWRIAVAEIGKRLSSP